MGCCCSCEWLPWVKRKPPPPKTFIEPPLTSDKASDSAIHGTTTGSGYGGYDDGDGKYEPYKELRRRGHESTRSEKQGSESLSQISSNVNRFVALWNYTPGSKAELSLRVGDRLRQMPEDIHSSDQDWLFVIREDMATTDRPWTGYVPKPWVAAVGSLEAEPWYFGLITGLEAENYLQESPDGFFLVRKRHDYTTTSEEATKKAADVPKKIGILNKLGISKKTTPSKKASVSKKTSSIDSNSLTKDDKGFHCDVGKKACAAYALTMKARGKFVHRPIYHLIERLGGGFFLTKKNKFATIPHLITFYQTNDVSADDLPLRLVGSPPKPMPPRIELSVESQKNWQEIPRSQIKLGQIVGTGHFGRVYQAVWKTADAKEITVAVKALKGSKKPDAMRETINRKRLLQEAFTMKNLTHKNLVRLFGVVSSEEPFWMITEFLKLGSLLAFLQEKNKKKDDTGGARLLPEETLVHICAQIANGMQYLEEKHVVHRDLAARNVLVQEETKVGDEHRVIVKVADFGLATLADSAQSKKNTKKDTNTANKAIPTKWAAPESLMKKEYSSASDVWSFGIVVHEVFTYGQEPYGVLTHAAVRTYVLKNRQILAKHAMVPARAYFMMKMCFRFEPEQRPHFGTIFKFYDCYYRRPGENSIRVGGDVDIV